MSTAAGTQRRRSRLRLLAALVLVILSLGSLYASLRGTNASARTHQIPSKPPVRYAYVPPHTESPVRVPVAYTLSAQTSPLVSASARHVMTDNVTPYRRVPHVYGFSTGLDSSGDTTAPPIRLTTRPLPQLTSGGLRHDRYPSMREMSSVESSVCSHGHSAPAHPSCRSDRLPPLKNGVVLFMAPHACDGDRLVEVISAYAAAHPVVDDGDGQPRTEFVPPPFAVSTGEVRTLRFLFHVLPALNRNVLLFHPYPVHVVCRGEPSAAYLRVLRSVLHHAVYVIVEDVREVLIESTSPAASGYVRTTFKQKLLLGLEARANAMNFSAALGSPLDPLVSTTTTPAPPVAVPGEPTHSDPSPVVATNDPVQSYVAKVADAWIEAWEERRFWSYQVWFLPTLAEYDFFWRLDAVRSVFTKPFDQDVFAELVQHGCAFGFHDVRYATHRFTRGVTTIIDNWNMTLAKSSQEPLPAAALRTAWSWLTDGGTTFSGKYLGQDFFLGALSAFQHSLMKAFWQTVESPLFFDAYKMRWDDGVAQTIVAETTAQAERWNTCHYTTIPGYRLG